MVLDRSFKKIDSYLAKIQKTACGFYIHHAKKVAAILRKDIKVHNEDSNLQFSIRSELQVKNGCACVEALNGSCPANARLL